MENNEEEERTNIREGRIDDVSDIMEEERTNAGEERVDDGKPGSKDPEGKKSVAVNIVIIFTIVASTLFIITILLFHLFSPLTATHINRRSTINTRTVS